MTELKKNKELQFWVNQSDDLLRQIENVIDHKQNKRITPEQYTDRIIKILEQFRKAQQQIAWIIDEILQAA